MNQLPVFNSIDVVILQCIAQNESKTRGASLESIIGFADYINHAVLTYEEFRSGISKLEGAELVSTKDDLFYTTAFFKSWRKKKFKKNVSVDKEYQEIKTLLDSIQVSQTGTSLISLENFNAVIEAYLQK